MSAKAPSNPPKKKPDLWREQLKTLADRSNLAFESVEERDKQGLWWSTYHLTNPDGSKSYYLGSQSGTTQVVAREYAAKQSYGALATMINTWRQDAMVNAAASTSMAVSAYSAPPTAPVNVWTEKLRIMAEQWNLTFVYEEQQDPQQTWVGTYHLTNPDGSKHSWLGSSSATTSSIARENAASEAVGTLTTLIEMWWPSSAASSTGAGPSGS
jgi:hypothetical protein